MIDRSGHFARFEVDERSLVWGAALAPAFSNRLSYGNFTPPVAHGRPLDFSGFRDAFLPEPANLHIDVTHRHKLGFLAC